MPGFSSPVAVRHQRAHGDRAGGRVDARIDARDPAVEACGPGTRRWSPRREPALHRRQDCLGHGEIELDRVGVVERRDHGAWIHEPADADVPQADTSRERSAYERIAEPGARRSHARFVGPERRLDLLDLGVGQHLGRVQLAAALILAARFPSAPRPPRPGQHEPARCPVPRAPSPFGTRCPSSNRTEVTRLETFAVTSIDSLARAVPSASISRPSRSMRAATATTGNRLHTDRRHLRSLPSWPRSARDRHGRVRPVRRSAPGAFVRDVPGETDQQCTDDGAEQHLAQGIRHRGPRTAPGRRAS